MPAEITKEDLENIIRDNRSKKNAKQFEIAVKCFDGIPEKGGADKENTYYYITKKYS